MNVEQPDSKKPDYRPAVKFRKINKDTLERLQTKSDNDDNQSSELNEEEDEDDAGSHGELEEDSETRPEIRNPTSTPFADSEESTGCRIPFKVDPTIDLKSHSVIDMIALAPFDSEKNPKRPLRQFPLRLRTRLAWQRHLRIGNARRIAGKP